MIPCAFMRMVNELLKRSRRSGLLPPDCTFYKMLRPKSIFSDICAQNSRLFSALKPPHESIWAFHAEQRRHFGDTADYVVLLQDKEQKDFPNRGGANGSIRFYPEITHNANAGKAAFQYLFPLWKCSRIYHMVLYSILEAIMLHWWIDLGNILKNMDADVLTWMFVAGLTDALELLKDVADDYESVGYADLFQLASATGIQVRYPSISQHRPGCQANILFSEPATGNVTPIHRLSIWFKTMWSFSSQL